MPSLAALSCGSVAARCRSLSPGPLAPGLAAPFSAEEGRLSLDDTAERLLPSFPEGHTALRVNAVLEDLGVVRRNGFRLRPLWAPRRQLLPSSRGHELSPLSFTKPAREFILTSSSSPSTTPSNACGKSDSNAATASASLSGIPPALPSIMIGGLFDSGFARVACPECRAEFLVAFSRQGQRPLSLLWGEASGDFLQATPAQDLKITTSHLQNASSASAWAGSTTGFHQVDLDLPPMRKDENYRFPRRWRSRTSFYLQRDPGHQQTTRDSPPKQRRLLPFRGDG